MHREFIRRIRTSFSAKIITLIVTSVVVTSFVVGLASTRTTQGFLIEKMSEKFPSVLASAQSRIRGWYVSQFRDLERLCASVVFRENLTRYLSSAPNDSTRVSAHRELVQYLGYVHQEFRMYEELTVYDPRHDVVASTADSAGYRHTVIEFIDESPDAAWFTPAVAVPSEARVYQWLLVPIREEGSLVAWMAARVDMVLFEEMLAESSLNLSGDLYILDEQGRFLTRPRHGPVDPWVGVRAMQVPTRQTGPVRVEARDNYVGRKAFHSKLHLETPNWWLIYEEDYGRAMAPVSSAQRRSWFAVLIIGAIGILVALRIVKSILHPIHELAEGAKRINEGLVGVKIPSGADDEIGLMIDTFNEMAKRITLSQAELRFKNRILFQKNDELENVNEQLETLSITDGLTGLFNHRHFWNLLNTELSRVDRYKGELALVMIDLDDFKRINDEFGHAVGDQLLQSIANILRQRARATDIVARYGGEEFAILMPDTNLGDDGTSKIAEKIRVAVESLRFKVPDTDIVPRVTVSLGVSVYRGNRREFFNAADRALYQSKAEGKNRIRYALT